MKTDIEIAKHILTAQRKLGYMEGVSDTYKKIDEVLDRIPWTMETSELRLKIRNVLTEMLVKSTE